MGVIKPFIKLSESRNERTPLVITCTSCGKDHHFDVATDSFESWTRGAFIQDAMPDLSSNDREMFISGMCGECFDKMFPDEEDE